MTILHEGCSNTRRLLQRKSAAKVHKYFEFTKDKCIMLFVFLFDDDPYFDMQGGNRYGRGQWATALRYWNGDFHVLFTSNSNGTFIYSSPTMEGKWRKTILCSLPYHPLVDRFKPLKERL